MDPVGFRDHYTCSSTTQPARSRGLALAAALSCHEHGHNPRAKCRVRSWAVHRPSCWSWRMVDRRKATDDANTKAAVSTEAETAVAGIVAVPQSTPHTHSARAASAAAETAGASAAVVQHSTDPLHLSMNLIPRSSISICVMTSENRCRIVGLAARRFGWLDLELKLVIAADR